MYQTNLFVNAILVLVAAFIWSNASAKDDITYSGATCKHSFQGDTIVETKVEYGSFNGIANTATTQALTVVCPIPHIDNDDKSNWIYVYFSKEPGAQKDAAVSCTLIERTAEGKFLQSDTDSDARFGNYVLSVHLENLSRHSSIVMECALPSHGSRIKSYRVRNFVKL